MKIQTRSKYSLIQMDRFFFFCSMNCFFLLFICFFPLSSKAKQREIYPAGIKINQSQRQINPQETVEEIVDQFLDNLITTSISRRDEAEKNADLVKILQKDCDMTTIARNVLGEEHWDQADSTQRSAFVRAFTGYFARKLKPGLKDLGEYTIKPGQTTQTTEYYVVHYYFQKARNRKNIKWKVSNSNEDSSPKIVDLSLNNFSLNRP